MARRSGRELLTREAWVAAALDALAESGVAGVAIDRLARRLGATRGSFYWHFRDRRELIDAALAQWERENTIDLIPAAEEIGDPRERLLFLFREVYERPADAIELALVAAVDEPLVAAVVARVTAARLAFLRRIFGELGMPDAEDRAWLAYAFYVGHHQLTLVVAAEDRPRQLDQIVALLTATAP